MIRQPGRRQAPARRSMQALSILALILGLAAVPGCAALGLGGVNLISVEEEWEMGRQIEAELAQELPLSQDPAITRMGERIVAQTDMANLPWRFYVVEEDIVNAFNAPGGLVYIYRGLIEEAADESELAGVMSHEAAHGVARHGTERLSQQYGMSILAGAVLGQEPGVIEEIVAQIVAAGSIARFSRDQEFEADEMGVRQMADADYNPRGMISFFERLLELQQREPGSVERFFATHPAIEERIAAVEAQIEEMEATDR